VHSKDARSRRYKNILAVINYTRFSLSGLPTTHRRTKMMPFSVQIVWGMGVSFSAIVSYLAYLLTQDKSSSARL
jgi:hypothetical protein